MNVIYLKSKLLIEKMNCAIEGIIYTVKTQKNIRYHFVAAGLVTTISVLLPISKTDYFFIIVMVSFVLVAEVFNTAIEELVNMVSPEIHHKARLVKDIAAGAVLLAAIGSIVLGSLIFIPYLLDPFSQGIAFLQDLSQDVFSAYVVLFSLLVIIILIVIAKAKYGKGEPLHGGMPSGHSAVAFSMGTSVIFLRSNPIVIVLTLCLAIMVSHSRLLLKIHTPNEVILGALLGTIITVCIFILFNYFYH